MVLSMKKIVIIGANSFLARNLIQVIRKNEGNYELKLYGREESQKDGEKNYTRIDVLDKSSVAAIDMKCDIIYFFVGKTGTEQAFREYETYIGINEIALLNVLSEYHEQKSQAKFIFPSSRLVYKGHSGLIPETDEKEGKSIYAINKLACERYLELYSRIYGVRYLIMRICVPYGSLVPGELSYGTMGFMLKSACNGNNIRLFGKGEPRRTLTHIEDLSYALLYAAESVSCGNDVYNVGGEDYSLKEMAELIAQKYRVGVDYVPWPDIAAKMESGDTVFDSAKLDSKIKYRNHTFKNWLDMIYKGESI